MHEFEQVRRVNHIPLDEEGKQRRLITAGKGGIRWVEDNGGRKRSIKILEDEWLPEKSNVLKICYNGEVDALRLEVDNFVIDVDVIGVPSILAVEMKDSTLFEMLERR
ncbi:hypothetical protein LIER_04084 [Lithospermum erythrorhizon]|uniref:Uncharacterized protein n=1 Tax=Lithospermum erythrorhizon TaxID=34254 RepID=A0AAV3NVV9_LITER